MTKFVNGLYVKKPSEKAPSWVITKLSFNAVEFMSYLTENANEKGYVDISILINRDGKHYAKLDKYERIGSKAESEDGLNDDIEKYEG